MFRLPELPKDEQFLVKMPLWIARALGLDPTRFRCFTGTRCESAFIYRGFRNRPSVSFIRVNVGGSPKRPRWSQRPGFKGTGTIPPISFTLEIFGLRSTVPPTSRAPYMTDVSGCTTFHVHYPTTKLSHKLVCTIQPHVCKLARRQGVSRGMRM